MRIFKLLVVPGILIAALISNTCRKSHNHENGKSANDYMHRHDFESLVERFESPERKEWQKPEVIIKIMAPLENQTVFELGAGTGYFSFRLLKKGAHVIAQDIDDKFLDYMRQKKAKLETKERNKIEIRSGTSGDPGIKQAEADKILTVNVYHHIDNRIEFFHHLKKGLRVNGKLFIIDFKKGELPVGPPDDIKQSADHVKKELSQAGWRNIKIDSDSLPYQYIIQADP